MKELAQRERKSWVLLTRSANQRAQVLVRSDVENLDDVEHDGEDEVGEADDEAEQERGVVGEVVRHWLACAQPVVAPECGGVAAVGLGSRGEATHDAAEGECAVVLLVDDGERRQKGEQRSRLHNAPLHLVAILRLQKTQTQTISEFLRSFYSHILMSHLLTDSLDLCQVLLDLLHSLLQRIVLRVQLAHVFHTHEVGSCVCNKKIIK